MENFRIRPKDRFVQEADWRKLYALTNYWNSELLFYKDDLQFLKDLIDTYGIWLCNDELIIELTTVENRLIKTKKICIALLIMVNKHKSQLADLIYNPFKYDSFRFRKEHEILEDKLSDFLKDFREDKKEVFNLTKQILKSEELAPQIVLSKSII